MKCHDCGKIASEATNSREGEWLTVGDVSYCPNCLRLAKLEKAVATTQQLLIEVKNAVTGLGDIVLGVFKKSKP